MDREQALDTVLGQIERQFGKGAVMKMNDQAQIAISAVSTGSLSLDVALGVGGLPRGRVVEVYGPESSGKTTLVYHVIAEAQRRARRRRDRLGRGAHAEGGDRGRDGRLARRAASTPDESGAAQARRHAQ